MRDDDLVAAWEDAIREHVARGSVDCLNCGGRLWWLPNRRSWGHVRGDRINVSGRCRPGSLTAARPAIDVDGQGVLDVEVPA